MTREPAFDQLLTSWLGDGANVAPERFVRAALEDVERAAQRGTRRATLEGFMMNLKPAALILGIAAVIVLTVAAYLQLAPNLGTSDPSPTVTASPTSLVESSPSPAARLITVADLPDIVLTEGRTPIDWERAGTEDEAEDLVVYPTRSAEGARNAALEVDAVLGGTATEFTGPPDAAYVCWAVVFETEADAQRALAIYVADFTSPQGWGLEQDSTEGPDGQEGAVYAGTTSRFLPGPAGSDLVPAHIRLWRVNNLLLVLAAFFEFDTVGGLHMIGDNMVARARDLAAGDPS
jgi:hypothetical protein